MFSVKIAYLSILFILRLREVYLLHVFCFEGVEFNYFRPELDAVTLPKAKYFFI